MADISRTFEALAKSGKKALIPFITAGDPEPGLTVSLMHALVEGGADILELGIPFSDPMAEGPVIQRACERALVHGVGLGQVLEMVAQFRVTNTHTPVVLMGYANPIEHMGVPLFVARAAQAGVNGCIVVDYPPEECVEFAQAMRDAKMDVIFLLAPTSTESRIQQVAELGRGFCYYVSLKGVTGAGHIDTDEVSTRLQAIRRHVRLPIGVGFGIRDAETARAVAQVADAIVIGSRVIQEIEQAGPAGAVKAVRQFIAGIREAIDRS